MDIDTTVLGGEPTGPPPDEFGNKTVVRLSPNSVGEYVVHKKHREPYEALHIMPTRVIQKRRDESPQPTSKTLAPPPALFSSLPHAPLNVLGRDTLLDELIYFVGRSTSITLYGAGGIGKTAVALTLLHHSEIEVRFGIHRHFVRCDNIENSLDGFLKCISEAIGIPRHTDSVQLRSYFTNSHPRILVLDGVDSLLDPRTPESTQVSMVIEEFGRCQNVCLLVTSRRDVKIRDFRHMEVPLLTVEASGDTFRACCSLKKSSSVDALLKELDFHPLSIALLAGAARENDWDERTLLERWNSGKTTILKAPGLQSLEENIESILRTPTIQELGTTAREILEAIATDPNGVPEMQLLTMFPKINGLHDAVNALCNLFLMYRQDGFLKMLSPFRLYFERNGCVSNPGLSFFFTGF